MSKKQDIFFIAIIVLMLIGTAAINKAQAAPRTGAPAGIKAKAKPAPKAKKAKRAPKATQRSYVIKGVRYHPLASAKNFVQTGKASWYGPGFHGKKTSNGERYNMHALTAAHKTLPLGTVVRVRNLDNGKSVIVRVNDRGPFHGKRVIDLSKAAAARLGFVRQGMAKVRVETLDRAPLLKTAAEDTPAPALQKTSALPVPESPFVRFRRDGLPETPPPPAQQDAAHTASEPPASAPPPAAAQAHNII